MMAETDMRAMRWRWLRYLDAAGPTSSKARSRTVKPLA